MIESVLAAETAISLDFSYPVLPSGRSGWVSDTAAPLRNSRGEVVGVISTVREITQRRLTENELRASKEQLRALAARLHAVREEESTRVAREIHDVLAQELTRLKMDVAWLNRRLAKPLDQENQKLCREKLAVMTSVTDRAIQSVQKIATELRPVVLDSLGLAAAIEWQAKDFEASTGIRCEVRVLEEDLPLSLKESTAVFRILQESLTNVIRHAGATRVEISLHARETQLTLSVRDNGRGIEEGEAHNPRSLGLLGMRERALLLNGRCEITGRPGEGTTVELHIPFAPTRDPERET
jgi:signal transduction histidine kinase